MCIEDILKELSERLRFATAIEEKTKVLHQSKQVKLFASKKTEAYKKLQSFSKCEQLLLLKAIAAGQEDALVQSEVFSNSEAARKVLESLESIDQFYDSIGGILGYQILAHKLLKECKQPRLTERDFDNLLRPKGVDIRSDHESFKWAIKGLKKIEHLAALCPIGGAGDRFGLVHPETKRPLPLAKLYLLGKTLLEHYVLDLIGLEYLYFKCTKKQTIIPLGLMTSSEKENDTHIREILSENRYFGRGEKAFTLFKQPSVPAFDKAGKWAALNGELLLKPGGHGMIWMLASRSGFLDRLTRHGKKALLVRQINNPLCSLDTGLMSFLGVGLDQDKAFGFASCPRAVGSKEGMNVVKEKQDGKKHRYTLTNIEYTDFEKFNIEDIESDQGSASSIFPSNTNILFASVEALLPFVKKGIYPGPILNFKEGATARIELMMQNIADHMGETFESPLAESSLDQLQVYLTYNDRKKTISTTKNKWKQGGSLKETNAGALFDWMSQMRLVFEECGFQMPPLDQREYETHGAPFAIYLHPALGPFFSIIQQKIQGGSLVKGSALVLDIAELSIENLHLEGSLHIEAQSSCGYAQGEYTEKAGRCLLRNVSICTGGLSPHIDIQNLENLNSPDIKITIEGSGEFIAEDVAFEKGVDIVVPSGVRLRAYQSSSGVKFESTPIQSPSWNWDYQIEDNDIALSKVYNS